MVFTFPDRRSRDLDNYLATGSKLVGDAVKGCFIPDDSPEHLTGWGFRFEFGKKASTTVVIEDADRKQMGRFQRGGFLATDKGGRGRHRPPGVHPPGMRCADVPLDKAA